MKLAEEEPQRMVERQIESRGITDRHTLEAMRTVPREEFVPDELGEFAYEDAPLPIEEGQTISPPAALHRKQQSEWRYVALPIGTGSAL